MAQSAQLPPPTTTMQGMRQLLNKGEAALKAGSRKPPLKSHVASPGAPTHCFLFIVFFPTTVPVNTAGTQAGDKQTGPTKSGWVEERETKNLECVWLLYICSVKCADS